jgi:hypothetical protein
MSPKSEPLPYFDNVLAGVDGNLNAFGQGFVSFSNLSKKSLKCLLGRVIVITHAGYILP